MSKLKVMTEKRAREIWGSAAVDLVGIDSGELRSADQWIRDRTLTNLRGEIATLPNSLREYVLLMVRCHFGSVETDDFLQALGCYPEWMKVSK